MSKTIYSDKIMAMNEHNFSAGPAMVRIDGAKVKRLREAKGLTQLYIATVVEVTTDTVSRWENKKYPTIKKENGLKLAEALEVDLEEILEVEEPKSLPADEKDVIDNRQHRLASPTTARQKAEAMVGRSRKVGHLSIIILFLAAIAGAWALYHSFKSQPSLPRTTATRVVAPHFVAGLPLPVFLQVTPPIDSQVSIILNEDLPRGSDLVASSPQLAGMSDDTIKWLKKISDSTLFYYTIITDPAFTGSLQFSGSVRDGGKEPLEIDGTTTSEAGVHHWSDTDGDNRISDEEILRVYDLLAGDDPDIIDLDLLEEMWLGDGYRWIPEQQTFSIIQ